MVVLEELLELLPEVVPLGEVALPWLEEPDLTSLLVVMLGALLTEFSLLTLLLRPAPVLVLF